ncbi:DUF3078 domain-containing protein [Mesonia aquimarina]|uniref:DUF3078 domain-containing protein n=1 Tax=Mesonia aquimarina TaxID=1504967 RepID=UPI000EF61A0D|nr:DUF3078 domain-containing protein [Mesonia aquimarina]
MPKKILTLFFCTLVTFSYAQNRVKVSYVNELETYDEIEFINTQKSEPIKQYLRWYDYKSFWTKLNRFGLDVSEVAFVNWNAGGTNSISGLFNVDIKRVFEKGNIRWKNELIAHYGINKQEGQGLRKTEDNLEINSTFGYRKDTLSHWFYSAKFNFNTQFSNGYTYPDTSKEISSIMAPGYLFLGIGAEYGGNIERLTFYGSPLTMKSTFVLNQELANEGAFGVTPAVIDEDGNVLKEGENVRTELGVLLTNEFNAQLFENIGFSNRLSLYSDYLNNFGNIDVNWELNFNFKVNEYVLAKLGSHLKYDDDVIIQEENADGDLVGIGPRVQWKQQLGIGVIVEL